MWYNRKTHVEEENPLLQSTEVHKQNTRDLIHFKGLLRYKVDTLIFFNKVSTNKSALNNKTIHSNVVWYHSRLKYSKRKTVGWGRGVHSKCSVCSLKNPPVKKQKKQPMLAHPAMVYRCQMSQTKIHLKGKNSRISKPCCKATHSYTCLQTTLTTPPFILTLQSLTSSF